MLERILDAGRSFGPSTVMERTAMPLFEDTFCGDGRGWLSRGWPGGGAGLRPLDRRRRWSWPASSRQPPRGDPGCGWKKKKSRSNRRSTRGGSRDGGDREEEKGGARGAPQQTCDPGGTWGARVERRGRRGRSPGVANGTQATARRARPGRDGFAGEWPPAAGVLFSREGDKGEQKTSKTKDARHRPGGFGSATCSASWSQRKRDMQGRATERRSTGWRPP